MAGTHNNTTKLQHLRFSSKFCGPLVDAPQAGLVDPELIAAAILVPKFRTCWTWDDDILKPDVPQLHVCKEDTVTDQQLCHQQRTFTRDQEVHTEPPQIKEEQEELCSSQEMDSFMVTPTHEFSDHRGKEPGSDQLLSHNPPVSESQHQDRSEHVDSGPTRNTESQCDTDTGEKSCKCKVCGKASKCKRSMIRHHRNHTGVKPYSCGSSVTKSGDLTKHMRMHTGERPYSCQTRGQTFTHSGHLIVHMRTHTGERPYFCETCGQTFTQSGPFHRHIRSGCKLRQSFP